MIAFDTVLVPKAHPNPFRVACLIVNRAQTFKWQRWTLIRLLTGGGIILLPGLLAGAVATRPSAPGSELNAFKDFLTNRPVIRSLDYTIQPLISQRLLQNYAPTLHLKAPRTNELSRVHGVWQHGQYLVSFPSASPGTPATLLFGNDHGVLWQISGGIVTTFTNDHSIAPSLQGPLQVLLDSLNLGIPNVLEGSLSWDGLQLSGLCEPSNRLTGQLVLDAAGRPSTLLCTVAGQPSAYRITYGYGARPLAMPLPETIELAVVISNTLFPLNARRFLTLETNSTALPETIAAPYRSTNYASAPLILVSNGVAYARVGPSTWAELRQTSGWRGTRTAVFAVTSLLAMAALLWARRRINRMPT